MARLCMKPSWASAIQEMNAQDVIYRLKLLGKSQRTLANDLGVSHALVNNTIHGRTKSRAIASAIANVLGEPVSRVFPGAYDDLTADR